MSSGLAAVRFPDGVIKFTVYNGTSDVLIAGLADEAEQAGSGDRFPSPEGQLEEVEIATTYGSGFWWKGLAARNAVLDAYVVPLGDFLGNNAVETKDGLPSWWPMA